VQKFRTQKLFVLAAGTRLTNITVILSPVDFRRGQSVPTSARAPFWTGGLYEQIETALSRLPIDQ
jgi:hypothetical protein